MENIIESEIILNFKTFKELIKKHFLKDHNPITWTEFRNLYKIKQKAIPNQWISQLEMLGLRREKKKNKTLWNWDDNI